MLPRHVYVHVPFCGRRCSYCDFAIAVRARVPVDEYLDALSRELSLRWPGDDRSHVDTIYLGGGTPSRLGPPGIARLFDLLRARATWDASAEITIEANPDDVTLEAARAWRASGATRVSLGAQSFDDEALRWMHRTHDAAAIGRAVDAIRDAGFDEYSLDLIFALPDDVHRSWERDLRAALALEPAHVSLYGLTVERHTPLGKWVDRGEADEAPEERYASEFLEAHHALTGAGYDHYEVSNFARPGRHARHNSAYWSGPDYAGLGPGAHELRGDERRWNVGAYAEWVRRLVAGIDPVEGRETLTEENRVVEQVYLGLRTTAGLILSPAEVEEARPWIDAGWARLMPDGRLVLTPTGWLRLDSLAAALTGVRSHW